jgi:hypothetical protein
MSPLSLKRAVTFGLFEKRIDGDDCLLELTRRRFAQSGMGAEMHAGNAGQLGHLLKFRPELDQPIVVHLPRNFALTNEQDCRAIASLATHFRETIYGFVIHDHAGLATDPKPFVQAASRIDELLQQSGSESTLFVEYAVGLETRVFADFFQTIRSLPRVSACLDIGHIGIHECRRIFSQDHSGADICALKTQLVAAQPLMPDIIRAVRGALPAVLDLVDSIGACGKPAHFHLHDGHPLSTFSPFGVADHLSFFETVPLPFECRDGTAPPLLFGPTGLSAIVARALKSMNQVSFTLEIHPRFERLALGDAEPLFAHWTDKTNAEQMNHWLSMLQQNHELLLSFLTEVTG